ncbi:hypothetical protein SteCoe_26460 [Stentor coeruleus]|uniref:RING-CH-type domain-containing protein n=1 Tax=Stentor coeruleus TaxID=5963 RepID=A0A1R2BCV1_9CILI|nr:hypothetical protein SteCoe_26460 [Stentor coeruleus]
MEETKSLAIYQEKPDDALPQTMVSEICCRICLDAGTENLISPCLCSGTGKYTHESCLKTWVLVKFPRLDGAQCEVCKSFYVMSVKSTCRCSVKHGIDEEFTYCCSIPILISILIAIGVILYIICAYHLDFKNKKAFSIAILALCIISAIGCLLLLIGSIYKSFIKFDVKHWNIESHAEQTNNSNII